VRQHATAGVTAALFLAALLVYAASPVTTSIDSMWTVYTSLSLVRDGNIELDEYVSVLRDSHFYASREIGGHYYHFYPYGPALLSMPFVWALDQAASASGIDLASRYLTVRPVWVERALAALFAAATGAVMLLIARETGADLRRSALIAATFAFGTSAWSTASRALWQHGPSMLLLSVALWIAVRARRQPELIRFLGLPLALAYVTRPTNAASIVVFSLFVALVHRGQLATYAAGCVIVLAPFLAFNWATFGLPLTEYYAPERLGDNRAFLEALAGNLISPARGLLSFTPVLVLAIAGTAVSLTRRRLGALELAIVATVGVHWIAISSFSHWWGGHSYGPRFFTDVLPYLVFMLIPFVHTLGAGRPAANALFGLLLVASVCIHARGAVDASVLGWNALPVDVDEQPGRLWDWRDPQFMRGLF
jgi:hypothetical protein